jgi:selenocysteine lyase/cysteine desulfurase
MIPALRTAFEQTLGWGVDEISAYTGALNERVAEGASSVGLSVAPPHLRAPHLIGVHLSGADPEAVAAAMAEANVHVSVRGGSVRVSPHVYNDDGDVERFVGALRAAL